MGITRKEIVYPPHPAYDAPFIRAREQSDPGRGGIAQHDVFFARMRQ